MLGAQRIERIQESRLTILERWRSPYERRTGLTFGSMESPVQHVVRHRRYLLTRVIEKEPVERQYHIGDKVYVCVHIRNHFIPAGEWTDRPTKRGVALHFEEWKELKKQSHCCKKESQN